MAKVPEKNLACCGSSEDIEASETVKVAFPIWSSASISKRNELIYKFKVILDEYLEELTLLVAEELGKNLDKTRGDAFKAIEVVEQSLTMSSRIFHKGSC